MHITGSEFHMKANHQLVEEHELRQRLRVWVGDDPLRPTEPPPTPRLDADTVALSSTARASQPTKDSAALDQPLSAEDQLKIQLLHRLFEAATGKAFKFRHPGEFHARMAEYEPPPALDLSAPQAPPATVAVEARDRLGYGIEYDRYERHYESERTSFSAQGRVTTADGRTLEIAVELHMSREFLREQHLSLRAGDAQLQDPLVLNFGGQAAELTTTRFSFDIDSNGRPKQISFVGPNSGFLVYDRNQDGIANDGSELFGPKTGDGFKELAAHDADGNGWIDANDPIYRHLRVWFKDDHGQDQLIGLGELGVGAIYLGHVTTPFQLKDADNELLGAVRATGLFLDHQGRAGTVQQVDLAV